MKSNDVHPIDDWKAEATKSETFGSVFIGSIGVVGKPRDIYIAVGVFILSTLGCVVARLRFQELVFPAASASMAQSWAVYGATLSGAILGFLISGFSLFATMTKSEHFWTLAKFKVGSRNISEFKFVFYNFLYIFAHYVIYLAICTFIAMTFVRRSPIWYSAEFLHERMPVLVEISAAWCVCLVGSYTIYAIMLLASFIWNLYQGVLFSIFFEAK